MQAAGEKGEAEGAKAAGEGEGEGDAGCAAAPGEKEELLRKLAGAGGGEEVVWRRPVDGRRAGLGDELLLFRSHLRALFLKRFHYAKRDRRAVCCNTVTPILVFLVGLAVLKTVAIGSGQPAYSLSEEAFADFAGAYGKETASPFTPVAFAAPDAIAGDSCDHALERLCGSSTSAHACRGCSSRLEAQLAAAGCTRDEAEKACEPGRHPPPGPSPAQMGNISGLADFAALCSKRLAAAAAAGGASVLAVQAPLAPLLPSAARPTDVFPGTAASGGTVPPYDLLANRSDADGAALLGNATFLASARAMFDGRHRAYRASGGGSQLGGLAPGRCVGEDCAGGFNYTVLQNITARHGSGAVANLAHSMLLQAAVARRGARGEVGEAGEAGTDAEAAAAGAFIRTTNHPLPMTARVQAKFETFDSFSSVIFALIAFSFIPASVVTFVVREKEDDRNAKHQQMISGVNICAYWTSNYLWDLCMYVLPFLLTLLLIQLFDVSVLTGGNCSAFCTETPFGATAVLFALFGLAIIPFSYCMSFAFRQAAKAQVIAVLVAFMTGLILIIAAVVMQQIDSTCDINSKLLFAYRLFPLFSLGKGLLNLSGGVGIVASSPCYDQQLDPLGVFQLPTKASFSPYMLDFCGWEMLYLLAR
jgi:hypothetical protein